VAEKSLARELRVSPFERACFTAYFHELFSNMDWSYHNPSRIFKI